MSRKLHRTKNEFGTRKFECENTNYGNGVTKNTDKIITIKDTIKKDLNNVHTNIKTRFKNLESIQVAKNRITTIENSKLNIKFNGNVKVIHLKVFLDILEYKIKIIRHIFKINEVIRQVLGDNAVIWFTSIDFESKSLSN